jgi:hypothetical protein
MGLVSPLARAVVIVMLLALAPLPARVEGAATPPRSEGRVEGTVEVDVVDDFANDRATTEYFVRTEKGARIAVALDGQQPPLPGARAALRAAPAGSTQSMAGLTSSLRGTPQAFLPPLVPQAVAVFLIRFRGDSSEPFPVDDIRGRVFTGPDSVNAFYQEQTGGQLSLTGLLRPDGDVLGWYTIPDSIKGCDYLTWTEAANAAAAAEGIDVAGYDRRIYLWSPIVDECPFAGRATFGGVDSWINGNPTMPNIAHELGHTFGAAHASSLYCYDAAGTHVSFSETCIRNEYGDPFDVMAKGRRHMHAWHKGQLGFLARDEFPLGATLTVTGDGTFVLAPCEEALPDAVQLLRIPRTWNPDGTVVDYYQLDFRQPFGTYFDDFAPTDPIVNGVAIRIARDASIPDTSLLLDATPETSVGGDEALPVGRSFEDTARGITVRTLAVSALGATVGITIVPDTVPPVAPSDLRSEATSSESAELTWTPATDNVVVVHQRVFRDDVEIGSVDSPYVGTFVDTDVLPEATYRYHVVAEDLAGNQARSNDAILVMPSVWPIVSVSQPRGNVARHGRSRMVATISGTAAIVALEIYLDGTLVRRRDYHVPRTIQTLRTTINLRRAAPGPHLVQFRAYDDAGRYGAVGVHVLQPYN